MAEGIRVLYVATETDVLDATAAALEEVDDRFEITTATDIDTARRLIDEAEIDCVVADHEVRDGTGIELLRTVRTTHPDLPFIIYTAEGSEAIASEAISAGVTDYLRKSTGADQYTVLANRITCAVEEWQSSRTLNERSRRLGTLIRNLPGIVYRCRNEPHWPKETVEGEAVESITGYSSRALMDEEVLWGEDIIHPADQDYVWESVQNGLKSDGSFELSYRIVTESGETKWVWERGQGVYENGELDSIEGFITDITDRKEDESELQQYRRRFEGIFNNPISFMALLAPDGTVISVNEEALSFAKTTNDAVQGEPFHETSWWTHSECLQEELQSWIEQARSGESVRYEADHYSPSGDRVTVDAVIVPIRDRAGTVTELLAAGRDITARKERERALQRHHEVIENVGDPIYFLDSDGCIEFVNQAFAEVLGYSPDEVTGEHVNRFMPDEDVSEGAKRIQEVLEHTESKRASFELTFLPKDGEQRIAEANFTVLSEDGDFIGTVGVLRDITERKRNEQALERQNERLKEFASVVSHDLRNPLSVATGRLDLAQDDCDSEHLDHVVTAHDRMEALIDDLLQWARQGDRTGAESDVALADLCRNCWETVDTTAAELEIATDATIRADPGRLRQMIENLVANAIEHGGPNVTVTIGTLTNGFYVADDGPGLSGVADDEIFEPGVTSSESGTGFGLAIVREIADAHGWTVAVLDSESGGVRFDVTGVTILET